ncbi:MAG TPA: hypothetical protein VD994_07905 [Prosthecobacter sp.]|nr:hypothetical protein [Prosthecobacter sp.]
MKRKLTIGTLTYDDFDGLYFTVQAIRLFHPEVADEIEFLILDNHPDGAHGGAVKRFAAWIREPVRYLPVTDAQGTALRDRLFGYAETESVLCVDSHVLLAPGSLRRLIDFFDAGEDDGNLLQGPLLFDDLHKTATHFDPVWRAHMWGVWGTDERGADPQAPPFEIPAQGLGIFACRKSAWPGFNPNFRGFGGEECYIHEKFRQRGKKTLCLPFLRWAHRFERPAGVPYPLRNADRIHNYMLGHAELGLDPAPVVAHFQGCLSEAQWQEIHSSVSTSSSSSSPS